jgi:DNA-directed RNA polymerase specialized sigma24 family protein
VSAVATECGDAELISRVRSGDLKAHAELMARHAAAARTYARGHARTRADAAELVTEASGLALATLQQGAGPDVAFRLFLFDCVDRAAAPTSRRRRPSSRHRRRPVAPTPASGGARSDLLARAFASLPERWQAALWHADVERESVVTVARHLGVDENAVAALDYRAREALGREYVRACLEHEHRMPCRMVQERLGAYVRNLLVGSDRARVARHLRSCPRCESIRSDLADLRRALAAALPPRYLGAHADAYLRDIARSRSPVPLGRPAPPRRWPATVAAAAAVAGLIAWGVVGFLARIGGEASRVETAGRGYDATEDVPGADVPLSTGEPAATNPIPATEVAPESAASAPDGGAAASDGAGATASPPPATQPAPGSAPASPPAPATASPPAASPAPTAPAPPAPSPPVSAAPSTPTAPAAPPALPLADISLSVRELTATITNHGPQVARSVRIEVILRRTSTSAFVPRSCIASRDIMRCTYGVGNVRVGRHAQIPLPSGTLLSVAATSSVADPNPLNNAWAIVLGGGLILK